MYKQKLRKKNYRLKKDLEHSNKRFQQLHKTSSKDFQKLLNLIASTSQGFKPNKSHFITFLYMAMLFNLVASDPSPKINDLKKNEKLIEDDNNPVLYSFGVAKQKQKPINAYAAFFREKPADEIPVHSDNQQHRKNIKKMMSEIETEYPKEISCLLKQSTLKLVIKKEFFLMGGSLNKANGIYEKKENTVYISTAGVIKKSNGELLDQTNIVKNEIHHALVDIQNKKQLRQKTFLSTGLPFLNKEGQIDGERREKFVVSIKEFKKNFKKLRKEYFNEQKKDTLYETLMTAVKKYYKPLWYAFPKMSKKDFNERLERGHFRPLDDGSYLIPHQYVKEKPSCDRHVIITKSIHENDPYVSAYFSLKSFKDKESNIKAFLFDFSTIMNAYNSAGHYGTISANEQLAELASHIDMLAPEIKMILCPKFCEYFTEFHELSSNYCERRTSLQN